MFFFRLPQPRRKRRDPRDKVREYVNSRGHLRTREHIQMDRVYKRWIAYLRKRGLQESTITSYLSHVECFTFWYDRTHVRDFLPDRFTSADLKKYQKGIASRDFRPATVRHIMAGLKSFVAWARKKDLLGRNWDMEFPPAPASDRPAIGVLTVPQQETLLQVIREGGNPRDLAIACLLLHAGLRVSELVALTWSCLAMEEGRPTSVEVRAGKRRIVPLNEITRQALEALRPDPVEPSASLWTGQRGGLHARGVQALLARHAKAAGLRQASPRILRDTFCASHLKAGATLETVAGLAGCDSVESVRRHRAAVGNLG